MSLAASGSQQQMAEEKLIDPGAAIGRLPNLRHEGRGAEPPYKIIIRMGDKLQTGTGHR